MTTQDFHNFLQKVAEFAKIASEEVSELSDQVGWYSTKTAAENERKGRYFVELDKAANALCESDFINEVEKRRFLKKAQEDPSYLAGVLVKVCNASDVALIGSPARVAAKPNRATDDPVWARAFGYDSRGLDNGIIDD